MRFGQTKLKHFFDQIKKIEERCYFSSGFILMFPNRADIIEDKPIWPIRGALKPDKNKSGLLTIYRDGAKGDKLLQVQALANMDRNLLRGDRHTDSCASVKFHINLNNMSELDESVVLGLIEFLKHEAEKPDNDFYYYFKCVNPEVINKDGYERFKDTDQLTIYFDKYSSLGKVLQLGTKIEQYLLDKGLSKNAIVLGPKDTITVNNFITARFDLNHLLEEYGVYRFFDVALKEFLEKHSYDSLKDFPIGVIDAVFNTVIVSFTNLNNLSKEDKDRIQQEFATALRAPAAYLLKARQNRTDRSEEFVKDIEPTIIEEIILSNKENESDILDDTLNQAIQNYKLKRDFYAFIQEVPVVNYENKPLSPYNYRVAVAMLNHVGIMKKEILSPKYSQLDIAIERLYAYGQERSDLRVIRLAMNLRAKLYKFATNENNTDEVKASFIEDFQKILHSEDAAFAVHRHNPVKRFLGAIYRYFYENLCLQKPYKSFAFFCQTTRSKNVKEIESNFNDIKVRHILK